MDCRGCVTLHYTVGFHSKQTQRNLYSPFWLHLTCCLNALLITKLVLHDTQWCISQVDSEGCKAFGQLEFWHRAFSAYGILSVGILAYGILSILLLAYSILAIHPDWHSQIIITAWTFNCVFHLQCPSIHVYNIPIWPKKV